MSAAPVADTGSFIGVHPYRAAFRSTGDGHKPSLTRGIRELPRQEGVNGRIKGYKIYVSETPFKGL